uniref:Eukaryotic elongation factor 2 kinase n=1 Tax=Strongyloides stercoralis TaxID=6248 RepID=A0A0K0EF31_STRER
MTVTVCDNSNNIVSESSSKKVKFSLNDYDEEVKLNINDSNEKRLKYKKLWKKMARKALDFLNDPWAKYNIHLQPTKKALRYRYNALTKTWVKDDVFVKMEDKPFANGAMRECYRLKKMSNFATDTDWKLAMNYVCKRYIQDVDRNVLFEDVRLQMDSKLWAEEFNRHNPPKKIDIIQMSILEFTEEEGSPLYHLEHFIDGKYIKHNSNSGFVSEISRMTPQAFSHFTFERSGHQLMVVDIQGVEDLYTDPQIHTVNGTDYGDGNLGTRGMALFFYSHHCNDICSLMNLTKFDHSVRESDSEFLILNNAMISCDPSTKFTITTRSSLDTCEPIVSFKEDAMESLRQRVLSVNYDKTSGSQSSNEHSRSCICDSCIEKEDFLVNQNEFYKDDDYLTDEDSVFTDNQMNRDVVNNTTDSVKRKQRQFSSNSLSLNFKSTEAERFASAIRKFSRPAGLVMPNVTEEKLNALKNSNSMYVLGQIHLDIARYYEIGKFTEFSVENRLLQEDSDELEYSFTHGVGYDTTSAIYHLDLARKCGVLEAIKTMADIGYDLPHDLLKDVDSNDIKSKVLEDGEDIIVFSFTLMELAAEMSERNAIHFVANAYETGLNLPKNKKTDWCKAMYWYEKALEYYVMDDYDNTDNDINKKDMTFVCPQYEILSKMAEMYNKGGFGLERNSNEAYNLYTEAAEHAMEAMKGKLAAKYYELAEMCGCDE